MITTRTRILSILATVAMLVSMLTCFVIPVAAAELSDYQEVLNDIASGATNLSAEVAKGASATADSLKAAAQADASSITWKTFVWDTEPFPRYALREAYEAAGYAQNQWSISDPADWLKMVADSTYNTDGSTLFSNTTTYALFTGVTFHLTQTIDFEGEEMPPLCFGQTGKDNERLGTFNGTIEGHGFGLADVAVVAPGTGSSNTMSSGLIGKLGYAANIKDFGVDSGSIIGTGPAKTYYISTFGDPYIANANSGNASAAKLTRVWCGATIGVDDDKGSGAVTNEIAAGFLALARNTGVTINGAYFYGTMSASSERVGILYDQRNEKVYNSVTAGTNVVSMFDVNNTTGAYNYNRAVDASVFASGDATVSGDNATADTAELAVYQINNLNVTAAAATDVDKVYYTITANGIRPTGTEANRIVTLTVNGGTEEYINNGTALTKADLAARTGLDEAKISTVMVNGVDKSGDSTFIVSGDTTILAAEAEIDWSGMLATAVAKYSAYDAKYFTAESAAKLTAFREAAAAAGSDQAKIEAALELEEGLEDALETYATYPMVGQEIPSYSLYNTYKDFNTTNNWAIKTKEDWLAMVTASNAATPESFDNYTFHVINDVDFDATPGDDASNEGVEMYPLSTGTGAYNNATGAFLGIIDGHGHAFKNINVVDNLTDTAGNRVIGLIATFSDGSIIRNFGVDSGKISISTSATRTVAATFGQGFPTSASAERPQLIKVWSGADIEVSNFTNANSAACGIHAYSADTYGGPIINGAYFYGSLKQESSSVTGSTLGIAFLMRTGRVYNSLSNPATATAALSLHSSGYAVASNIYSVNHDPISGTAENAITTANGNAASALEAAWKINNAQPVKAHTLNSGKYVEATTDMDAVYYTITANGIRPTGTATNRIVELKVNDKAAEYVNNGTTYTKAELAAKAGIAEEEITTIMVNGADKSADATFTVDNDTTITVAKEEIDFAALLAEAVTKYSRLDAKYLTAESAAKLNEFLTAAASAGDDQAAIEAALVLTNGLDEQLKTYETYPEADGKEIPEYSLRNTYGIYNENNVWAIEAPADWLAMVEDSKADGAAKTFENYTFHVLNDVDFSTETNPMDPLNFGSTGKGNDTGCSFNGTIEGHNHAFKNINVSVTLNEEAIFATGMIGKLGQNAVIRDFGVDSGSITVGGTASKLYVATFGEPQAVQNSAELYNVWSGVTITANTTAEGENYAAGILTSGQDAYVTISGAYFYGTLNAPNAFGIYEYLKRPLIYNALSVANVVGEPTAYAMHRSTNADHTYTLINNFSVGAPIHSGADWLQADVTANKIKNSATVESALEGAWKINTANYADAAADGVEKVFFTITGYDDNGDAILRFGASNKRVAKYTATINGGEPQETYANVGGSIDIRAMFGLAADDIVTVTVGGTEVQPNENGTYKITGDATIESMDLAAALAAAKATLDEELNKYAALDSAYLKTTADIATEGKIGLPDFRTQVADAKAADNLDLLKAAVAAIENIVVEVSEDYNKVPGYKDYAAYQAYNKTPNWAIRSTADWLAMVAASNAETFETFEGITIHVLADIDFADETTPMLPLAYGTGENNDEDNPVRFRGTIEGHGHVFKNVNIDLTVNCDHLDENGDPAHEHVAGLIAKMGTGATINNFGVESGTIKVAGVSKGIYVSTFGKAIGGKTVTLNKVWSGVTLIAETESPCNAAGILAPAAGSNTTINGAYFYGTLNAKRVYGMYHSLYGNEKIYNVLGAPTVVGSPTADLLFLKNTNGSGNYSVVNAMSVGRNIYSGFDGTDANVVNAANVSSALEGAWRINAANFAGEAATGVGKVYFTKVGDAIRFGEESNRIVKFSATLNGEAEVAYANAGNAVNVKALFDLETADVASFVVTVDGVEVPANADGTYSITGDATVVAEYNETDAWIAQLQAKIDEYENENLNTDYFKTADELAADEIGLADFISRAKAAISATNNAELKELVSYLKNRKLVVEITTNYQNLPEFKEQAKYYKYNKDKNWLILDPADWEEMDRIAKLDVPTDVTTGEFGQYLLVTERTDSETGEYVRRELYFIGVTFHLKQDVDFANAEWLPLGARDLRAFRGTIDGHGYGFSNINIFVDQDDMTDTYYTYDTEGTMNGSIGLIAFLGRGAHLKDFGINSGTITAGAGGNAGSVSSFGCVFENNSENPVTFTRVWSGADLLCKDRARKNVYLNALVGSFNGRAGTVNVNGFVFSGTMGKQQGGSDMAFGIYGGNRNGPAKNGTFANIVSFPTVSVGIQTYLFGFGSDDNYNNTKANISNVYGVKKAEATKTVGMVYDYRNTDDQFDYDADGNATNVGGVIADPTYLYAVSAKEAAWMSNVNQTAGENAVYFTLTESGDIRPVASDEYEIIKVTVNGNNGFVNKGYEMDLGNLAAKAGVKSNNIDTITVNGADMTASFKGDASYKYTLTDDTVFEVVSSCKHDRNTNEDYTPVTVEGERMHELLCTECGDRIGDPIPCELTVVAGEVDPQTGESFHTVTCAVCGRNETEECNGVGFVNPDDCTQDKIWEFDCGVHTGEYYQPDSAPYTEHDFAGSAWTYVEGSTTKQYRKCSRCATREYRIYELISATDITPELGASADVIVTLPTGLASADLKFTISGEGYEITNVVGATKDGEVYKVNGATTVTVTVSASTASRGGTFKVDMTNAVSTEANTTFVDASATSAIEFAGIKGDASNDRTITLKDALDTLYVVVGKKPASTINLKNANVHNPTENPVASDITIEDVRGIMVLWLQIKMEEV